MSANSLNLAEHYPQNYVVDIDKERGIGIFLAPFLGFKSKKEENYIGWFNYIEIIIFALINASLIYIIANGVVVGFYLVAWILPWRSKIVRAAILSILPALIFIFSGVMILSIPLIVFSIVFAGTHIYISLKNSL